MKVNLRKRMTAIIRKAGLQPWPKLFQNLRSTRETELIREGHPEHLVYKWIGNRKPVATSFCLQMTDDDFRRAAGRRSMAEAVQNPVQQASAGECTEPRTDQDGDQETTFFDPLRPDADPCSDESYDLLGHIGLEQPPLALSKTPFSKDAGAKHGAPNDPSGVNTPSLPPELAEVVKAWPNLPEAIRAGILAMLKTEIGRSQ